MANDSNHDDIPTLRDLVRPGTRAAAALTADDEPTPSPTATPDAEPTLGAGGNAANSTRSTGLSDDEIEAIARRVVERQTEQISLAVARAIRQALDLRDHDPASGEDDGSS